MEILHQLGELFLAAVPTVIIVFLFYFFMRWAFFTPIENAMAERSAKIEGARAEAARIVAPARNSPANQWWSLCMVMSPDQARAARR